MSPVPELLDHCCRAPCPGVALLLLLVVVYRCPLPVTELVDPRPSFPTDMLEHVLSCLVLGTALRGIRRIVFLLVMALQALSPPPCAEVEALNLSHLRNATLTNGAKQP